jgi:hypothetical protein
MGKEYKGDEAFSVFGFPTKQTSLQAKPILLLLSLQYPTVVHRTTAPILLPVEIA